MNQNTSRSSPRYLELGRAGGVSDLGLPSRPLNSLRRRGISTIGQLIAWSAEDLQFEIQGLGAGGIEEIKTALARQGLNLAETTTLAAYMGSLQNEGESIR